MPFLNRLGKRYGSNELYFGHSDINVSKRGEYVCPSRIAYSPLLHAVAGNSRFHDIQLALLYFGLISVNIVLLQLYYCSMYILRVSACACYNGTAAEA